MTERTWETRIKMSAAQRTAWAEGRHKPNAAVRSAASIAAWAKRQAIMDAAALADPNCITDGSGFAGSRFARCSCGAIEALLFRECADRFACVECRAERVEAVISARRVAA